MRRRRARLVGGNEAYEEPSRRPSRRPSPRPSTYLPWSPYPIPQTKRLGSTLQKRLAYSLQMPQRPLRLPQPTTISPSET